MKRALTFAAGLSLLLFGVSARAESVTSAPRPHAPETALDRVRVRPAFEIEAALTTQELVADYGSTHAVATRSLWVSRLSAGVDVRLPASLVRRGHLDVLAMAGVGYVFETGDFPVHFGAALRWQTEVARRLSFPIGVSARVVLDTTAPARSSVELGLPIGIRFSVIELVYQPRVVIPLGAASSPLLGGERRIGAKAGVAPIGLVLRCVL